MSQDPDSDPQKGKGKGKARGNDEKTLLQLYEAMEDISKQKETKLKTYNDMFNKRLGTKFAVDREYDCNKLFDVSIYGVTGKDFEDHGNLSNMPGAVQFEDKIFHIVANKLRNKSLFVLNIGNKMTPDYAIAKEIYDKTKNLKAGKFITAEEIQFMRVAGDWIYVTFIKLKD